MKIINNYTMDSEYIEFQKKQIELANQLIEKSNGNKKVIKMANEIIKICKKCISIERNMNKKQRNNKFEI